MAGIEGEPRRGEPTPQQRTPTEQHKPQQEADNGALGIPSTLKERAKPPPESEAEPARPKRKRGRPKLSEFSEEERTRRWVERHERLRLREWRREQRQREATLSESERRDLKALEKAALEGARAVIRRVSEDKDSVKFQVWPPEREKKRKTKHDIVRPKDERYS